MERLGDLIIHGLKEGIAYERGELKLRVTKVVAPPPPPQYGADDVVRIREKLNMSQAAFARVLAVSKDAVQNWEQGRRAPTGGTLRLLQILEHPEILPELTATPRTDSSKPPQRVASASKVKGITATASIKKPKPKI